MNITENAANELKNAIDKFNQPGAGIRIFSFQGCCGPSIQMEIATHPKAHDTIVSLENIDFFIEKRLLETLATVTIEYRSDGFQLAGLKKSGSCCGS
jgi:Fe-S cluster assembly iron-binding protein IscA